MYIVPFSAFIEAFAILSSKVSLHCICKTPTLITHMPSNGCLMEHFPVFGESGPVAHSESSTLDSPDSDNYFKHRPLDTSRKDIRLLQIIPDAATGISCTIAHYDIGSCPAYIALSYTWGSPTPRHVIGINAKGFEVGDNLYRFLLKYQASQRVNPIYEKGFRVKYLWIDQICIDQERVEERNHQVRLMSSIYQQAAGVITWLGSPNCSNNIAMKAIKEAIATIEYLPFQYKDRFTKQFNEEERRELEIFLSHPYWRRVWIIQEIVLASSIWIYTGEAYLEWAEFVRFCKIAQADRYWIPPCIEWLITNAQRRTKFSMFHMIKGLWGNECQEPRDKIYGLQGIVIERDKMTVDYSLSVKEIFLNAAIIMMGEENEKPKRQDFVYCLLDLGQEMGLNCESLNDEFLHVYTKYLHRRRSMGGGFLSIIEAKQLLRKLLVLD